MAHVLGLIVGGAVVALLVLARLGVIFSRRYRSRQDTPPDLSRFSGGPPNQGGGNQGVSGGSGPS